MPRAKKVITDVTDNVVALPSKRGGRRPGAGRKPKPGKARGKYAAGRAKVAPPPSGRPSVSQQQLALIAAAMSEINSRLQRIEATNTLLLSHLLPSIVNRIG
jgi:hypothetical protein